MSFGEPTFLIGLLLVPMAVLAQVAGRQRARRHAVRFTGVSTLKLAAATIPSWRRHVPAALALAALSALVLALAKPERTVAVPLERASIMLVTDHSRSMLANDVSPNRLTAAKRSASTFLNELPRRIRVGVVAFSDAPDAVQAPTTDHGETRQIIQVQVADGASGPAQPRTDSGGDRPVVGREDDHRPGPRCSGGDGPAASHSDFHGQPRDA